MKYEIRYTNQFYRDLKLAEKQHKKTSKLFEIIKQISNGEKLDKRYRDHELTGNFKGVRECYIEPDWLLLYEIKNDILVLIVYRNGTHSDIFKK